MRLEAQTTESVFALVAAGLGVSIIPPFFAPPPGAEATLRPFRPAISLDLATLRPTHKPSSRLAQRVLEVAHEFAAEYGDLHGARLLIRRRRTPGRPA